MPPSKTETICGLTVKSTALPVMDALDLVPEVLEFAGALTLDSDAELLEAGAKLLANQRFRRLLPRLLAGTKVMLPENGREVPVQLDTQEMLNHAFDNHRAALFPVCALAFKTSFADFFAEGVALVKDLRTPKQPSQSD